MTPPPPELFDLPLTPEHLDTFRALLTHAVKQRSERPEELARLRDEVASFVQAAEGDPACHPELLRIMREVFGVPGSSEGSSEPKDGDGEGKAGS